MILDVIKKEFFLLTAIILILGSGSFLLPQSVNTNCEMMETSGALA